MQSRSLLMLIGATAIACGRPSVESASPGQPESQAIIEPDARANPELSGRFWIVDGELAAYDLDGQKISSRGHVGDAVRRLPDGRLVALETNEELELWLQLFDPSGQAVSRVQIPNDVDLERCAIATGGGLEVQSPGGFRVNPVGTHACLELLDRNENMADVGLTVAVELGTGELAAWVSWDAAEQCEGKPPAEDPCAVAKAGAAWVELDAPALEDQQAVDDWPFAYDDASSWLSERGEPTIQLCEPGEGERECASVEAVSPSGRWLWMTSGYVEGDYIYRNLVLLDRSTGTLLQVLQDYEQPPRMLEVSLAELYPGDGQDRPIVSVVGESDVGWLPGDRLWVDGLLLIPERRAVVEIGGRRALALERR